MSNAWSNEGIGQRIGRDKFRFDYRDGDRRIRCTVTRAELTAFLTNGVDRESNLGPKGGQMTLERFFNDAYLPDCARPRFLNPRSYEAEVDLTKALSRTLGATPIHQIRSSDAEEHKSQRIEAGRANSSIKKELRCLGRAMEYAASMEIVRKNPLKPVRGLPSADRSSIWLRLQEIDRLTAACPARLSLLVEFLILTGARIGEALLFEASDVRRERGVILIPTEKRKAPARDCLRSIDIKSLGPRFERLLERMEAKVSQGRFFPMTYPAFNGLFAGARTRAKLDHIHAHDLRGTFCIHRALVVKNFRQLQYEMGHRDAKSVESYLGRAEQFDPTESIFYMPPSEPESWTTTMPPIRDYPRGPSAAIIGRPEPQPN